MNAIHYSHVLMMSKAIREYVKNCGCDKVLANHALLQPLNVKRALEGLEIPFDIKIHGSAILFVLKKHPQYTPLAVEAIEACNKLIAGTQHVVNQVNVMVVCSDIIINVLIHIALYYCSSR